MSGRLCPHTNVLASYCLTYRYTASAPQGLGYVEVEVYGICYTYLGKSRLNQTRNFVLVGIHLTNPTLSWLQKW